MEPLVTNDAGHGGKDPGAVGLVIEKDYNFMMADYANQRFLELGITSVMNRASTETLEPSARTWRIRNSGAKYCLCWHNNAGEGDGAEVIYSKFSSDGGKLAYKIADCLREVGQNIRRVYYRDGSDGKDYYYMHRDTGSVETIIIESAFVDNAADAAQLKAHWKDFAEGVVKAFCLYIGHDYKPTGSVKSSQTTAVVGYKEIPATVNGVSTKAIVVGDNTHLIWTFLSEVGLREGKEFTYDFPTKDTVKFKVFGQDVDAVLYKEDSYLQWNKIPSMKEPTQRSDGRWDFTMPNYVPPAPQKQEPKKESVIQGTTITGDYQASADKMLAFVRSINQDFPNELPGLYIETGRKYGIRGDIAFCQMLKETNFFKFTRPDGSPGDVRKEQNNMAGLGATGGVSGASFSSLEQGVLAHIQHLFAYATILPVPLGELIIDPRFNLVSRGSAPNWENLNGKWAVPGDNYGQEILAIYKKNLEFKPSAPEPIKTVEVSVPPRVTSQEKKDYAGHWAEKDIDRVMEFGLMKGTLSGKFYPDQPLTRAQFATVLGRLIDKGMMK